MKLLKNVMKNLKNVHCIGTKLYNAVIKNNRGFGLNEFLGIAVALIIAAFVIIPELKSFASKIMTEMDEWWDGTISYYIFPNS
jgi:hypothetical protein